MGNHKRAVFFRHPLFAIAGTGLLFVAVAWSTYFITGESTSVPELPTVHITAAQSENILEYLKTRVKGFQLTSEEKTIVAALQDVHLAETDLSQGAPPQLPLLIENLERELTRLAQKDTSRYLIFGDALALDFCRALFNTFGHKPDQVKTDTPDAALILLGGAFYRRARAKRLIDERGNPTVPKALFSVLYRNRWRLMAHLPPDDAFTHTEKLLLHEFTVRFAPANELDRRLKAIAALKSLNPSYDADAARMRVRYEASILSKN